MNICPAKSRVMIDPDRSTAEPNRSADPMTTLVTCYSLTGHTDTVGNSIADRLGAKTEPIVERTARAGLLGSSVGAVNAYIDRHRDALDRVAFFCTQGKFGAAGALSQMGRRLGHPPLATLVVNEDEIEDSALDEKIEAFLSDLRDAGDRA